MYQMFSKSTRDRSKMRNTCRNSPTYLYFNYSWARESNYIIEQLSYDFWNNRLLLEQLFITISLRS